MNILIIGNGFDLAHGLPTTYKDFLDYVHVFKYYYETENKGLFEFADKYQRFKLYILNLFENSHEDEKMDIGVVPYFEKIKKLNIF